MRRKFKYLSIILILIAVAILLALAYSVKSDIGRKHRLEALYPPCDAMMTRSLIHEALSHSDIELFRVIYDRGIVDPAKFDEGHTIFTYIFLLVPSSRSFLRPEGLSGSALEKWDIEKDKTQLQFLKIALEHGADVNALDNGWKGYAPIHHCVTRLFYPRSAECQSAYYDLLFQYGADVNLKSRDGDSPLHLTLLYFCDLDVAQILIEHGADVNAVDAKGKTSLDIAIEQHCEDIIQFLIKNGAKQAKDLPEK